MRNLGLNDCASNVILIEEQYESRMVNRIIILKKDNSICLSYKFWNNKKSFILIKKETIQNNKLNDFVQKVRTSDLFKNENNNGEYYCGEIIISIFSKNKVEVFPYMTYNFSNDIFRSYNAMFE